MLSLEYWQKFNTGSNTGSLKPCTFFKAERLNFNDYLFLFGLFNCISLAWKKLINSRRHLSWHFQLTFQMTLWILCSATIYLKDSTLPLDSITSSKLYWKLIETIQVYPSARHKFSMLFENSSELTLVSKNAAETYWQYNMRNIQLLKYCHVSEIHHYILCASLFSCYYAS